MNKYEFLQRGNTFTQTEANFEVKELLDAGIYNMCYNPQQRDIYLEKIGEKFEFPFKLYGVHKNLVNSVCNYFKKTTTGNLGVLLNGTRGTGKTVTAKVIANSLNLPVIIVSANFPGLTDFIAKCQQDIIFFFDEFEKNFSRRNDCDDDEFLTGEELLSVMDGVYNSENRHVFLLTTNNLYINENFLSRPSRIRYRHTFGNTLDSETLREFIDDNLNDKKYANDIINFVNDLSLATIDIVKSIIEEVNIQGCDVKLLKDIFNVDCATYNANCWVKYVERDDDDYNMSIDDFLKEVTKPKKSSFEYHHNQFTLTKPLSKFNIGDGFIYGSDKIISIDLSKRVVISEDNYKRIYTYVTDESKNNDHDYSLVY